MRPASNSNSTRAAVDSGFQDRTSPIPYLYASLALMLGLIAVALIILACSYRKSSSHSSPEVQEKSVKQLEMEPKIVVIMAGDHNPTYLAKPVSCCTCQAQQQQNQLHLTSSSV